MEPNEVRRIARQLAAKAAKRLEDAKRRGVPQPLPDTPRIGAYAHTDAAQHEHMREPKKN